jgi:hypothetical protein
MGWQLPELSEDEILNLLTSLAMSGSHFHRGDRKPSGDAGLLDLAKAACEAGGLKFGVIHSFSSFEFANAKDTAGNSIQISSRGIRKP